MNVKLISRDNSSFPSKLKTIYSAPQNLYIAGDVSPLHTSPVVSIVGSRAVTPYGRQVTQQLARDLSRRGVAVVSGLALGVDSIAHISSLEAGGYTAAVLPSPVDKVYPASHRQLAQKILSAGGALISEYGQDDRSEAFKSRFIARNRLVSGLADVLLITEASEHSGTLHTANFALEQGRTVMAVPGNITSPGSRGANNLIKAGAIPVTEVQDILAQLNLPLEADTTAPTGDTKQETTLLQLIHSGITDAGILQVTSNMEAATFNRTLTMLEINGKIRPLGVGHWTITG